MGTVSDVASTGTSSCELLSCIMTFNPVGYLLILIIPSADAIDDDMVIGWRHLTPDLLKKRGACSIVSLDNIQEELIDLGNHLFKEDGVGVDALWYEVWINEMRTWWYLMYPMGYDTSKIDRDDWDPHLKYTMDLNQMREKEQYDLNVGMWTDNPELRAKAKAERTRVESIVYQAIAGMGQSKKEEAPGTRVPEDDTALEISSMKQALELFKEILDGPTSDDGSSDDEMSDRKVLYSETSEDEVLGKGKGKLVGTKNTNNQEDGKQGTVAETDNSPEAKSPRSGRKKKSNKQKTKTTFAKAPTKRKKKGNKK